MAKIVLKNLGRALENGGKTCRASVSKIIKAALLTISHVKIFHQIDTGVFLGKNVKVKEHY